MTLVIVCHDLINDLEYSWHKEGKNRKPFHLKPEGLLVATDTAITTPDTGKTLLNGFRKAYEIPIKVWKPYFLGTRFHSYRNVYMETSCFIAIAGSTLTAQHVLNSITTHLGKLRISYKRGDRGSPGRYCVIRHCQKNDLEEGQGINQWPDMFLTKDIEDLVTADVITENIGYSINESLDSARKYKLDEPSLKQMQTDFAAGVYCPASKQHRLYTFRMYKTLNADGVYEVFTKPEEVPWNQVAVLGMREKFEAKAQTVFNDCIRTNQSPRDVLFNFLGSAIDEVQESGSKAIDKPYVIKKFENGKLETIRHSSWGD